MAAGVSAAYGGNAGYDDQIDVYDTWDSTVNNHGNTAAGDVVALWDKKRLLGISVIEDIVIDTVIKQVYRCPYCEKSTIKERKHQTPRYHCQRCKETFDLPRVIDQVVTRYVARHDAAWTSLDGMLTGDELRALCESPRSQLSMRELAWAPFLSVLVRRSADQAVAHGEAAS